MPPSNAFKGNILGQYSSDPVLALLEISHPELAETIRVVDNGEDITSNGNVFQAFPFELQLPGDLEGEPKAQIEIANVTRLIGDALDAITTPANVRISLILASDPDTLQLDWINFELRDASWNALVVQASIIIRQFGREPAVKVRVAPGNFQNLAK
jgi:hypothetical protein